MRGYQIHFMPGFSSYGTHVESSIQEETADILLKRDKCRNIVKS